MTHADLGLVHLVKAGDPADAREHGLTLLAECGLVWVPRKRRLKDFPPCPECEAIAGPIKAAKRPEHEIVERQWRTHYVYRCFDAAGVLLYVGCTSDLNTRRLAHNAQSWWFPQAESFRVNAYLSRSRALTVEAEAIFSERPLWNVRHQDFKSWSKEQLARGRDLAAQHEAPDAVLRRFVRLAGAA